MSRRGLPGISRETRLLAVTIGVSLAVLLVLSQFRFPASVAPDGDSPAAQPLARLAARAAFDDLSLAVRELTARVEGSLLVLRARSGAVPSDAVDAFGWLAERVGGPAAGRDRLVPALRVRDDLALALADTSTTFHSIVGLPGVPTLVASDAIRGIALLSVPAAPAPVLSVREGAQPPATPGYLAVTEAASAGAALRPVFVGRSDAVSDPRWDTPLFTIGRSASADLGAPVFMLDGRLAGVVTPADIEPALVPAQTILAAVDVLMRGGSRPQGDIGVTAQELDVTLTEATGAPTGAAIAAVEAGGPAAALLEPGDVVTAVEGQPVRTAMALRIRVARSAPGSTLSLTIRRGGGFVTVPVLVRARPAPPASTASRPAEAATPRPLGLTMRVAEGRGSEIVRVQAGSLASSAGLRPGDVVIGAGRQQAPTPEQLNAAVESLARGKTLFLSVDREGTARLVSLTR